MADNTELNTGSGGDTIASDDISDAGVANGAKVQRVKAGFGSNNAYADPTGGTGTDDAGTARVSLATDIALPTGTNTLGDININNNNTVSTNNSSSSTLVNDAVFTGTGEDISSYSSVSVQVFASHASATDGLSMEFSTDSSNWDEKHIATIAAATEREFIFPCHAQYFRIVYTNGGTTQTSFRLQVILHVQSLTGSSHALDMNVAADDVGALVKSVLIAQAAGSGEFVPVQATAAGNLKTSIEEVDTSASGLGKVEDAAHSSGDVGVMSLAVRNDVLATLADTDGDYAPFQVNADGGLWTHHAPNEVDSNNSTTSTLANDAVFTGTGVEVLDSASVAITIDASHNSATDGIQLQFSTDNSNWDVEHLFTYTAADGARIFQLGAHTRYFRLIYTNGGTSQTHFRVQTLLLHSDIITTIHRLVDSTSPDRSATVIKSVIMAQAAGSGDFVPVQATAAGNFKTSLQEISDGLDIGAGNAGSETQRVSVSTDDVNLASINTDAGTIAGAVSGTEMQVDVISVPGSISGPGEPSVDSYTQVAINLTTAANQVLVSSAANKQIWVYGYMFTCGDAAGQTVSFQDEDDAALSGVMEFAQYGGASVSPSGNFSMPIWKLATDKDLEVDITGGDVDGWLTYAILSV